jgi:LytS/YehU family sensor histidine kinase
MALDQRGGQEVPLKDELEFLQKYLEIEQARFGDRLSVTFDIAPETLDAQVPNLLLQPLVENSIRHAVACASSRVASRSVRGSSRRTSSSSSGTTARGMPHRALPHPGKGVGLANTRSRLERLYGANTSSCSVSRQAAADGHVTIPFKADDVAETDDFAEDIKGVA